ncbi:MAG: phosphatidate cytidylyltransferase [Planctomycetota bacterium]|nr:phosphatidate cytidylyltransferase [Planctomycetota bacterium]MDA1211043.1 phosphatidate cytidylyltransferase [Planctomycetota bacterium]
MLQWRLTVSATLIPLLFLLFAWDHRLGVIAPVFIVLTLLIVAGCVIELVALLQTRIPELQPTRLVLANGWIVLSAWVVPILATTNGTDAVNDGDPLFYLMIATAIAWLALSTRAVFAFRAENQNIVTLAAEGLTLLYLGIGIGLTVNLRWVAGHERGYLVLGSMILAVKFGDVGAYTIGRLFGRTKFVPRLSPGKTWAGVGGAMVSAVFASAFWLGWIAVTWFGVDASEPRWTRIIVYGLVMGVAGIIGDLSESLIKRDAGQKDSGNTIPGFGGVLDLMDSLIFAGPCAYLFWRFFPPLL